jgi:CopG family transcriptional regulator/antitoxin EndoAI
LFLLNLVDPIKEVGVLFLAQLKKILISLPDNLLKEVDSIVAMERINRSEFVREAMKLYIREKRRIEMRDKMKKGYQQMAEINEKLAEIWFEADNDQQQKYEEGLRELEK